jgi:multisubunit Na+/H+ antiporter MnhG subunit
MDILKLALLVVFMWFTSPTSSHMLAQIEYYTNPHLYSHVEREISEEAEDAEC